MTSLLSQVAVPTIQAPSGSGSASLLNVARGAFTDIGRNAESALDRLIEKERLQKEEARQAMLDQEKLADRQYMLAQREKLAKEEAAKDVFNKVIIEGPQVIGGIVTDRYNLQNQAAKDAFELSEAEQKLIIADPKTRMTNPTIKAKLDAQEEFSKNYTNLYDTGKLNETRAEMIQRAAGLALKPGEIMPQEIVTQLDQAKLAQEQARLKALEDSQREQMADAKLKGELDLKLAQAMGEHGRGGSAGTVKGGTKTDEKVDAYNKAYDSIYEKVDKMGDIPERSKNSLRKQMQDEFDRVMVESRKKGLTPNPTSLANSIATKVSTQWTSKEKEGKTHLEVSDVKLQQLSAKEIAQIPTAKFAYETQTVTGGSAPKDTRMEQAVLKSQREEVMKRLQGYEAKKKALEMNPTERRNAEIDALLKGIKPTIPEAKVEDKKVESTKSKETSKKANKKVVAKATVESVEAKPVEKPKKQTVKNTLSEQVKNTSTALTLDAVKKQLQTPEDYTQIEIKKAAAANAIMAERIKGRYKGKTAEQWKALAK